VYSRAATPASLARDGLREYAAHPLLRTVGVDRSYYAPVPLDDLRRYAEQLPEGFPCCFKAPASMASPTLPGAKGTGRGEPNPRFLSAERFALELLEPVAAVFRPHAGPFIVEITPSARGQRLDPAEFVERLDRMLGALPREFHYAVELRESGLLTPSYERVIRAHGASHVFNYWSAMPMPGVQARTLAPSGLPFILVRLLLRPGTWYEDQREQFRPFNRIVEPDEEMRAQVVDLVAEAVRLRIPAYVVVNNKAEGSAPLTVRELAWRVADRLEMKA
jgi:uncharacterized protein YecE (DUF72 family)